MVQILIMHCLKKPHLTTSRLTEIHQVPLPRSVRPCSLWPVQLHPSAYWDGCPYCAASRHLPCAPCARRTHHHGQHG